MEILIAGEKTLSEAVPPIPKFVDLIRTNRVRVRDGDKLHSRWSKGIEAGQLATTRRQREGKGLNAVTEEITPR